MSENTQGTADALDEQERAILEEYAELQKAEEEKFDKALEYFRDNGVYKGNFDTSIKEWLTDNMVNNHIGYVYAEYIPEEKNKGFRWSPTGRFFRITEESAKEHPELRGLLFSESIEDGDEEDGSFTYLVHQWCNFEDDYRGYILLPLRDGRYWLTYFVC